MVERLRRQLNDPWQHAVSERTGNNERYGIIYRADVLELLEEPTLLAGPDAAVFDRVPCRARFKAGAFDFIALTVHLSYTDAPRRKREADALARIARDLAAGPEKDILVLGDFNEQRAKPNLAVFNSVGFRTLNTAPTNLGSNEVYDNILLNPNLTREWLGVVDVVRFDETYFSNDDKSATNAVSDHRPVWAEFATAGVDDD
jgi:endonuclease/exonuclease/phosphatase family metal-dependent hydrolase